MDYDLIVIGGGTAGLDAGRTAARRGAAVAIVADGPIGGDCTFTGCVPSKTLIEAAAAGLSYTDAIRRVQATTQQVAATEDPATLQAEHITVLTGHGRLDGPGRVLVDGSPVHTRKVVIATGSTPQPPAIEGLAGVDYHTTDTVFGLDTLPRSLAVLGGGATGCELAQAFTGFGSQVTIIEAGSHILPDQDAAAATVISQRLAQLGVRIHTSTTVQQVSQNQGQVQFAVADAGPVAADQLLVATGRRPVTGDLGLDTVGIEPDERGYIPVNDRMATAGSGVYAAGDVTGLYNFTHAADAMARTAVTNALSRRATARFRTAAVPQVIFTDPELAQVGPTEAQLTGHGGARVCYLPMSEVDRALTAGRTEGFVKLIIAPAPLTRRFGGGRLIGATIVGPRAGELIAEPALAIRTKMFAGRLAQTIHAYPTWGHSIQLAAAQLFGHGRAPRRTENPNRRSHLR
jgi:pyruvate/2-oxoglutarate dehydrogenase complex dihydrolipoamide dehydrogenase (E3) component